MTPEGIHLNRLAVPLGLDMTFTVSDGEFGCFSDQNSSSKSRGRHSLFKELNFYMSELTPRKRKLYQRTRRTVLSVN
jgi:hypothetical protein